MAEARTVQTLLPGQWAFVRAGALKTLLGSCVSILVWHRERGFGGMCHYLLPERRTLLIVRPDRPETKARGKAAPQAERA